MIAREGSKEYLVSFITVELLNLLNSTLKIYITEAFFISTAEVLNSAIDVLTLTNAIQINMSVNMRSGTVVLQ